MNEPHLCLVPKKNGKPCHAIGEIFDPDVNRMVCQWHTGPQLNTQRETLHYTWARKGYEAVIQGLSDEVLAELLKDLRKFREGKPLTRKAFEVLDAVRHGESARKEVRKFEKKSEAMT